MKRKSKKIEISIIVPAYMAESVIYENLCRLHKILRKSKRTFEIICVVDGGTDDTYINAKRAENIYKETKVISYKKNRGKGYAVRFGMKKAGGTIVGFIDAGWDLIYKDILNFLDIIINTGADMVVGSKRHSKSVVKYPITRKLYSLGYQFYVKHTFNLSVNDTQVGMKIFKKKILDEILPILMVDGFAFDIEILAVAQKMCGAKIVEAPIHVNLDENSSTIRIKGGFLRNSIKVFWDTLVIYYNLNISGSYKNRLIE